MFRGRQLTCFDAKNVTVTHRGVQLTCFDAKNVTVTHRGVQLTYFDAKNVTVTHGGLNRPFRCLDFLWSTINRQIMLARITYSPNF